MPLLGREPDTQVFRDIQENPGDETFDGIAVLRLDGGRFFATAEALENRIRDLVDDNVRALVLDLESATAPASPSKAKMPAPVIEPIPRNVAPLTVIFGDSCPAVTGFACSSAGVLLSFLPSVSLITAARD